MHVFGLRDTLTDTKIKIKLKKQREVRKGVEERPDSLGHGGGLGGGGGERGVRYYNPTTAGQSLQVSTQVVLIPPP